MKKVLVVSLLVTALIASLGVLSVAATTGAQTLTYEVTAINEISVSGTPSLTVITAVAGQDPTFVEDDTDNTYSVTTNSTSAKKITVGLNSDMTSGLTLLVKMASPTIGATGKDAYVDISNTATTAANVLTAITKTNGVENAAAITYKLSATAAAGVIASDTRTVTFTLTDD